MLFRATTKTNTTTLSILFFLISLVLIIIHTMKIKSVTIKNYKSIKEITIPFEEYGVGNKKSKTALLVGINESGKSAILEALNLINREYEDVSYEDCCFKLAADKDEDIIINVNLKIEYPDYWTKHIKKNCEFPDELCKKIRFKNITKNIKIYSDESEHSSYSVEIDDFSNYEYVIETNKIVTPGKKIVITPAKYQFVNGVKKLIPAVTKQSQPTTTITKEIKSLKKVNNIKTEITQDYTNYIKQNQEVIDIQYIKKKIESELYSIFEINIPKVQIWRPSEKYLLNSVINLDEFKDNPNISIPLKNMFHIYGKIENKDIKSCIEKALSKQEKCDELIAKMSNAVTKHLNKIWKEHKISIKISINGVRCEVFIEDKDRKHSYFKMNQRSEGFKQFVSLILSLSAQNESQNLSGNLIIIDEPEVHLHPSGIKYMRDELLKLGKKNQVFVATHSPYMVDTDSPERHWIVEKKKSETKIKQVNEDTPIEDDAVLKAAFGLSTFRELLPENMIIVEGGDDKAILLHVIDKLESKFFYSIKSAGGASKTLAIASFLNEEKLSAFFLFDDDKDGKDHQRKIIANYKESFTENNTLTIKCICNALPDNSTIEDLLPLEFVKSYFETELDVSLSLDNEEPVLFQIKKQYTKAKRKKIEKDKLNSLKLELSKKFIEIYNSKKKIENEAPKIAEFTKALINKLQNDD